MEKYLDLLSSLLLFDGIDKEDLSGMLKCLGSYTKKYYKDDIIFLAGDAINVVGIILDGEVLIIREDFAGNRTIHAQLKPPDVFGEVFACAGTQKSPITAVATTDCEILFIEFSKIVSRCGSVCSFHTRLIRNMMQIMAIKNLMLNKKNEFLSKRSIRDKLASYLLSEAEINGSLTFEIRLNRHELADFLCVDRSALSRELGNLRDEGIVSFNKNSFTITDLDSLTC